MIVFLEEGANRRSYFIQLYCSIPNDLFSWVLSFVIRVPVVCVCVTRLGICALFRYSCTGRVCVSRLWMGASLRYSYTGRGGVVVCVCHANSLNHPCVSKGPPNHIINKPSTYKNYDESLGSWRSDVCTRYVIFLESVFFSQIPWTELDEMFRWVIGCQPQGVYKFIFTALNELQLSFKGLASHKNTAQNWCVVISTCSEKFNSFPRAKTNLKSRFVTIVVFVLMSTGGS